MNKFINNTLHSSRYDWSYLSKPGSSYGNISKIKVLKLGVHDNVSDNVNNNCDDSIQLIRKNPRKKFIKPSNKLYKPVNDYVQHWTNLIKLEQSASQQKFNNKLEKWPVDKLKEEGYVVTNLSGYYTRKMYGKHSALFQLSPGEQLPYNRFRIGDIVRLSAEANRNVFYTATIESTTPTQIQLVFERRVKIEEYDKWRIDYTHNDVSFRRSFDALESLHLDPSEQTVENSSQNYENALRGTHLRDILLNNKVDSLEGIFESDCLIKSWVRRYAKPDPVIVEGDPVLKLNRRQLQAVALMIGNRMSLIQGPPGTGKTATISNSIHLMKRHFNVPHQILIAAHTNVATDNIASILLSKGLKIVRLGHISRVSPSLRPYTLTAQTENHDKYREVKFFRYRSEGLFKKAFQLQGTAREQFINEAKNYRTESNKLVKEIKNEILLNCDVVCSTCLGANVREFTSIDFPIVFIDEGSQATEPTTLIPLMKGSSHLSIIGDHKQLAPIITSEEAHKKGLGISLFERLIEHSNVPSIMLDIQYRMHPELSDIPNTIFYNSQLMDGSRNPDGSLLESYSPPLTSFTKPSSALSFINHEYTESKEGESTLNEGECQVILSLILDLLACNPQLKGNEIGIISPYIAQTIELLRLLNRDAEWSQQFIQKLGQDRLKDLSEIEVKTVDGFEGREKSIIILSLTRSNEGGFIGFLDDPRRANVGLTRAKKCLLVVGNSQTLEKGVITPNRISDLWSKLIKLCKSKKAFAEYSDISNKLLT